MEEYFIIEKEKSEFQKLLNQWKHQFSFEIIWITYNTHDNIYRALIKRSPKEVCPHGTLGGYEKCMKCNKVI